MMLAKHIAIALQGTESGPSLAISVKRRSRSEKESGAKRAPLREEPKTDSDDKDAKPSADHQATSGTPPSSTYISS
jgi:hypothetical protein